MNTPAEQLDHLGKFERLQLVEDLWDRFAAESQPEPESAVLDELEQRAQWRDTHPGQGKTLGQIAQALGVRL